MCLDRLKGEARGRVLSTRKGFECWEGGWGGAKGGFERGSRVGFPFEVFVTIWNRILYFLLSTSFTIALHEASPDRLLILQKLACNGAVQERFFVWLLPLDPPSSPQTRYSAPGCSSLLVYPQPITLLGDDDQVALLALPAPGSQSRRPWPLLSFLLVVHAHPVGVDPSPAFPATLSDFVPFNAAPALSTSYS